MKFAYKSGFTLNKALRLLHVDIFMELPIKKGIVDIKLNKGTFGSKSNGEDSSHCDWFHHWRVGVTVILTIFLVESFGDQACFIFVYGTIRVLFDPENPFAPDGSFMRRKRYQAPCFVSLKSLILLLHNFSPVDR